MNLTFIAESPLLCFQRLFLPSKVTVFLKHRPLKALKRVEYRRVICSLRLYMSCIKNYKMRIYGCAGSTHWICCMVRRKQVMANLVHSLQIREALPFLLFCFLGLGSNPHLSINVNNCVWVKSALIKNDMVGNTLFAEKKWIRKWPSCVSFWGETVCSARRPVKICFLAGKLINRPASIDGDLRARD